MKNEKEWKYKIMVKTDKKTRDEFEKDLDKLFKSYNDKSSDGYIEVLNKI